MSCPKIRNLMESGAKVIDVRSPSEYHNGRIKGAVNIPLQHIENSELSKDETLLVYCKSGARSESAKRILESKGHKVHNIGGIIQYMDCVVY